MTLLSEAIGFIVALGLGPKIKIIGENLLKLNIHVYFGLLKKVQNQEYLSHVLCVLDEH